MNPLNPLKSSASEKVGDASHEVSQNASQNAFMSEGQLFDALPTPQVSCVKQVWAVGGGKGGVGKSLIASSLAIALARTGEKVTAIDFDLGGSNLHTSLGVELPKLTLSDFLNGGTANLQDVAVPSGIPQLDIISGAQDSMGVAQIDATTKRRVLEAIPAINSEYVVFDLGAGTSFSTLDFYLYADLGVIILLPEPTSIENAYRFIKSSYYRHLWHAPSLREIRPLVEMAMDARNSRGIRSPSDLFREVNLQSSEMGLRLKIEIEKFRPKLIVNQARTQADIDIGFSVKAVCRKYFGIDMDYVGYLDYDSAVWQAVRRKRPLFLEFPNSRLVSSIERVVQYMIKNCSTQRSGLR